MIFGLFVMLVAIIISLVSAYYSIMGLTALFVGAFWPIIIMGSVLELGKIVSAIWLHINWKRSEILFKFYLVPAVLILMLITSMGIFGGLSKYHLDQNVPSGNIQSQIELIDSKILTRRNNIASLNKNLAQLDASVDETLKRSTTEGGAARAAQLRRNQTKDRQIIQNDIESAQKNINELQEERTAASNELRLIESHIGPVKYVAALIYGDNPSMDLLERAVRWVIILIVIVFDPLAIVLILAGTIQIQWARADKLAKKKKSLQQLLDETPMPTVVDNSRELLQEKSVELAAQNAMIAQLQKERDRLFAAHSHELERADKLANQLAEIDVVGEVSANDSAAIEQATVPLTQAEIAEAGLEDLAAVEGISLRKFTQEEATAVNKSANMTFPTDITGYVTFEGKLTSVDALKELRPDLFQEILNRDVMFGSQFPQIAKVGDIMIKTNIVPHTVHKYIGQKWIQVDKNLNTSYVQHEPYIEYLISKIDSGEYDARWLTDLEQEAISNKLK